VRTPQYVTHAALDLPLAAGDVLGARLGPDGVLEVFRNGVPGGTANVSSWAYAAAGGRIGMGWWGGETTSFRADDFGGGTLTAAGPPLAHAEPAAEPVVTAPPRALSLSGAYPNPSRRGVTFDLELPRPAAVAFEVVDVQGRLVWSAPVRHLEAGRRALAWDGARGAAGVYVAVVRVDGARLERRFVRLP
jgi:hypothetical protein